MTADDVKIYCFSNFVKHAHLVNSVYPARPGEEGPRASELAYLVYYASHRPEKLPKVGAYLEKKTRWDLQKNKRGYHKVTLDILNALIEACSTQLHYFARSTMRILNELTELSDAELLALATITFIKFNQYYDGSLASDNIFEPLYSQLTDRYCNFCTLKNKDENSQRKIILSGLEAIKSIVFSRFIFQNRCQYYARKVIPAILSNIQKLATSIEPKQIQHHPIHPTTVRRHTIFDDILTDDELGNLAITCLQQLVKGLNVANISCVLEPIFAYLDDGNRWAPSEFPVVVFYCAAKAAATQSRALLMTSLLVRLRKDDTSIIARITLLRALSDILLDTASPSMGVSIYEIIDLLLVQLESINESTTTTTITTATTLKEDLEILQQTCWYTLDILLLQMFAVGQLRETLTYIVTKIPTNSIVSAQMKINVCNTIQSMETLDIHSHNYNHSQGASEGRRMSRVSGGQTSPTISMPTSLERNTGGTGVIGDNSNHNLHINEKRSSKDHGHSSSKPSLTTNNHINTTHGQQQQQNFNHLRYDMVGPIVGWLADHNVKVRSTVFDLLASLTSPEYLLRVPVALGYEEVKTFLATLYNALLLLANIVPELVPRDVMGVYEMTCSALIIHGDDALLDLVPLLLKIQQKLMKDKLDNTSALASCCLINAIIAFFQHVGVVLSIQSLLDHTTKVIRERTDQRLWTIQPALQFNKSSVSAWREVTSFAEVIDLTNVMTVEFHSILSRAIVVQIIADYTPLNDKYEHCASLLAGDFPRLQREPSSPNIEPSRLRKPRSTLRFDDGMKKDTMGSVDEFRAILEGKRVQCRPTSIIQTWQPPAGDYDLEQVLDEIATAKPRDEDEQRPLDEQFDEAMPAIRPPVGDFAL